MSAGPQLPALLGPPTADYALLISPSALIRPEETSRPENRHFVCEGPHGILMQQVLSGGSAIDHQFQNSSASRKLQGDDYAACSTSVSLIRDTGEAVEAHLEADFSSDPQRAYLEFWGVMQAIFVQQDAIFELHRVIAGARPILLQGSAWASLRDIRNTCAGHPADSRNGAPTTQRTFMGRSFGKYDRITYELWETGGRIKRPTFNLRRMIHDYDDEAGQILQNVLVTMRLRWP